MIKKSRRKKDSNPNFKPKVDISSSFDVSTLRDELSQMVNEKLDLCNTKDYTDILVNEQDTSLKFIHEKLEENLQQTPEIEYKPYESELMIPDIIKLITKDLSEPYSIYTYRYFIHNWPDLCFLALHENQCIGAIVCKLDIHKKIDLKLATHKLVYRGYIAMLAIDKDFRRKNIGTNLVLQAITTMIKKGCEEVVLETEITNSAALSLYENMGFVRDKRLYRYYLNGVDAYRLKLWLK